MKAYSEIRDTPSVDLDIAFRLLGDSGATAMYDYLEKFGDRYARLANGVAKGNSLAGNVALDNMKAVAFEHGKALDEEQGVSEISCLGSNIKLKESMYGHQKETSSA